MWPRRSQFVRPALICMTCMSILIASGCSDDSRQSGTQVPILESDQETFLKSREARKLQAKAARAKSSRSRSGSASKD